MKDHLPIVMNQVPFLPTDGTGVKDHLPIGTNEVASLPADGTAVLNTACEKIKKSEVAEGKLKAMFTDSTATEALEQETSSHLTVPVPTATIPTETPNNRFLYGYRCTTLLVF